VRHSILAVDDEEMIRDFLAAALESGGYIPIEAASAGEAYAKLEAGASSLAGRRPPRPRTQRRHPGRLYHRRQRRRLVRPARAA